MAETTPSTVLQLILRSFGDLAARDCADRELLHRFLGERDAEAFEAILRRHGPMVLDVCRAVLGNEADVEDAFQATFLVLARKAASIREAGSLAAWLHGVAHRTALKARAESSRCRLTATPVPERGAVDADDLSWREVRQVLHEELDALPERVRGPLVLCYLEGMTQDRAAAKLGLSKGTLRRRLDRGRAMLARRLARRGFEAALLLAAAWPAVATAGMRPAVAASIVEAATSTCGGMVGTVPPRVTSLTEGILKSMYLTKLKAVGTTVLVCAVLVLAGVAVHATVVGVAAGAGGREPSPRAGGVPDGREPGATWKARATLEGHKDEVVCLSFGSDRLATADKGGSVKVWDAATGKEERTYSYPVEGGPMEAMAFTPGGNGLLVAYGDRLARWDAPLEGRPAPKGIAPGELPLPALLTVNELWVLRRDAGKQWAWEQRSALTRPDTDVLLSHPAFAARAVLRRAAAVPAMALSSGGATLAVGGDDGTLTLWDVRTRKARASCKGPADDLLAVEFSADGKTLASAGKSGMVRLWEAATGKELVVLKGHEGPVRSVAFSPDGATLASGGDDKTVSVWDVKAAKRLAVLEGHTGAVLGVAFSGDGKLLASAGKDKTIRLWEPKQAEQPDALKERLAPPPPKGALPQAELQGRIDQYERAFRAQTQVGNRHRVVDPKAPGEVGNAKPIKMLVTLEKVTVGKINGESRSIAASQTTLGAENPFFKPLKFENLAVSDRPFNARAETVHTKPTFAESFRHRRCLVPADAFYEGPRGKRHRIGVKGGGPFAFAGLWDVWTDGATKLVTCCFCTTTPNELVRPIHDRMPAILGPGDYAAWLDPGTPPAGLRGLLRPYPAGEMEAVAV